MKTPSIEKEKYGEELCYLCDMIVALRHIVLFFTLLLVAFSEGRAIGIERVAIKNGVFEAADIGAAGKKVLGILEKAPVKVDIISEFGVKIQSNVDNILAVFPNEPTHLFYQKLAGRSDEIHEVILNNLGDIGLRSADDLTVFFDDIAASGANLMEAFATNPNLVKSWESIFSSSDNGIKALRINTSQLQKFENIVQSNNLGLDADELRAILNAAVVKGQQWDFPENILDAVKRASDAEISGLTVTHKKFPESAGSGGSYLIPAKNYQKAASGDANLSFEIGGRSFDDIGTDGKLIDRKFGYGNSIFDKIEDEFGEVEFIISNESRIISLLNQAKGQLIAANGKPIRWELSNQLGADGVGQVFNGLGGYSNLPQFQGIDFSVIEVIHVP